MRLAWSNRIALLGVVLGIASFVSALLYVQSIESSPKIETSPKVESAPKVVSYPKIEGLPLKPTAKVPWCSASRNLDRRFCYMMAREYEKKGRLRDAAQAYSNSVELMGRPNNAKDLKLLDDYVAFLNKYGAKGSSDAIKKMADRDRQAIIAWEIKYAKEQQQEAKAATGAR